MRLAAGVVSKVLCTPLPQVLAMKLTEFHRWQGTAREVWDATRLKFE